MSNSLPNYIEFLGLKIYQEMSSIIEEKVYGLGIILCGKSEIPNAFCLQQSILYRFLYLL